MKKITFLSLLLSLCVISLNAQTYFTGYGKNESEARYLTSITIDKNGVKYLTVEVNQTIGGPVYFDKTASVIEVAPGDVLKFQYNWTGVWMHNIIYVDWDKNGVFSTEGDKERLGYNGAKSANEMTKPINYTVPVAKPGDYRIRMMVDWVLYDDNPSFSGQSTNVNSLGTKESISGNGGAVVDATLRVKDSGTSVTEVDADKIYTFISGNTLNVAGVEAGTSIAVYSIDGKLLVNEVATGTVHSIDGLAKGLYIVKAGEKTFKVIK